MERARIQISMELLSDTIFGSGYSIPGEEDIAVCKDAAGYPYMKGTTIKGLLRDSMINLVHWTKMSEGTIDELMGQSGWDGTADERRINISSLTLKEQGQPDTCYSLRTFTSLENGVAKKGTLRTASCIRAGLTFTGIMECATGDAAFLQSALKGIKWVGTLRNRGFGRVKVTSTVSTIQQSPRTITGAKCLHYRLKLHTPVVITDKNQSVGYHHQTRNYIPGSAIRGMVCSTLAQENPSWFMEHKIDLLSDATKFLDAVPNPEQKTVIPSIKGFYEKKDGSEFQTVLENGELSAGVKRSGMGSYCAIEGQQMIYWSANTEGSTRIKRTRGIEDEKLMFQHRYLCQGQEFDGYILLEQPEFAAEITSAFKDTIWIGAERYAGNGECEVQIIEAAETPAWLTEYGYQKQSQIGTVLYLLAVSPFTMTNQYGEVCGLNIEELEERLGIGEIKVEFCSTSILDYRTYNRTWQCHAPMVRMYDRGSIFKLSCSEVPALEKLQKVQEQGLGIHLAEGYGQILFVRQELFEQIKGKQSLEMEGRVQQSDEVELRRSKIRWIMKIDKEQILADISRSQLGSLQSQCEKSIDDGDLEKVYLFLEKTHERGAKYESKFVKVEQLVKTVMKQDLQDTLSLSQNCKGSDKEKLELLCKLFDYSRKAKEGK